MWLALKLILFNSAYNKLNEVKSSQKTGKDGT